MILINSLDFKLLLDFNGLKLLSYVNNSNKHYLILFVGGKVSRPWKIVIFTYPESQTPLSTESNLETVPNEYPCRIIDYVLFPSA